MVRTAARTIHLHVEHPAVCAAGSYLVADNVSSMLIHQLHVLQGLRWGAARPASGAPLA